MTDAEVWYVDKSTMNQAVCLTWFQMSAGRITVPGANVARGANAAPGVNAAREAGPSIYISTEHPGRR